MLNPPRTGVDGRVTEQLEQSNPAPRAIVYVSCNPATLARDLARMPRYRIASLRAFDMFPQTAHVETVCELVPAQRMMYVVEVNGQRYNVEIAGRHGDS